LGLAKLYMQTGSELLTEALPEALKNVLLVMSASGVFITVPTTPNERTIRVITLEFIDAYMPDFKDEFLNKIGNYNLPAEQKVSETTTQSTEISIYCLTN